MVKAEKIFPYAQIRHEKMSIDNNKLLLFRNKDDEDKKRIQKEIQDDEKKIRRTPVTA